MNAIIFGATGMIGQGVLRECLPDRSVERVLTIGHAATRRCEPKLEEQIVQVFRPDFVQPRHSVARTGMYNVSYRMTGPLYPVRCSLAPTHITITETIGRATIEAVRRGAPKRILENRQINAVATIHEHHHS
jgi:hypothetical protein